MCGYKNILCRESRALEVSCFLSWSGGNMEASLHLRSLRFLKLFIEVITHAKQDRPSGGAVNLVLPQAVTSCGCQAKGVDNNAMPFHQSTLNAGFVTWTGFHCV